MTTEKSFKRLANQSAFVLPPGGKTALAGGIRGFHQCVISVSHVARDWNITPRRVRVMLSEGRLNGRQLPNGVWEVFFPYSYVFGTRGPTLKRQQKGLEDLAAKPKRLRGEELEEWNQLNREARNDSRNDLDKPFDRS